MRHTDLHRLRRLLTILALLSLFAACRTVDPGRELPEPVVPQDVDHRWRQDLARFERELPRGHYDLFHQLSVEEFRTMVAELDSRATGLSAAQFDIELRKILARIGDSHTNLSWKPERLYPFAFYPMEEGVVVAGTDEPNLETLGMRLVAIDGMAVESVRERMSTIIPHENEAALTHSFVHYLRSPEFLYHLGIAGAPGEATFTFADYQGGSFSITAEPRPAEATRGFTTLAQRLGYNAENAPLYVQNRGRNYWWRLAREEQILYIAYNRCIEDKDYPISELLEDIDAAIATSDPQAVVVDLRHNGGGDSRVFAPVTRRLADGHREGAFDIYTFVGRQTFSSAILNAIELEEAGALLVGEPTGGKPNHYGEIKFFELPNLEARVSYSTKYFQRYTGERGEADSIYPDIAAPISLSSLLQRRDPAMEAVEVELASREQR